MKKIRGSSASYKSKSGLRCDVDELAQLYSQVGNVPERVNFTKASEITLLARAYLYYKNRVKELEVPAGNINAKGEEK